MTSAKSDVTSEDAKTYLARKDLFQVFEVGIQIKAIFKETDLYDTLMRSLTSIASV